MDRHWDVDPMHDTTLTASCSYLPEIRTDAVSPVEFCVASLRTSEQVASRHTYRTEHVLANAPNFLDDKVVNGFWVYIVQVNNGLVISRTQLR